MKKLIVALLIATLPLAACKPPTPRATTTAGKKFHRANTTVYQFADGRVGYRDASSDMWFYMMLASQQNNQTSAYAYRPATITPASASISRPVYSGGWTQGAAPSPKDLKAAEEVEAEVVLGADGRPTDAEEAAEPEAEATATETDAEAAAAESAAANPTETTEAESAPSEGTSESSTSSSESSTSSDSGSSSSDSGGGGGDSGGGGGE